MTLTIAGVEIGEGHPCRFVAEISNNHNGDLSRAIRLITAAKNAGADFIKLQTFTVDELCALRGEGPAPAQWSHMTMRELYTKAQTPLEWIPALAGYCDDIGIPWFSSVFGAESLALLESLECPALKVARIDAHHAALVDSCVATGKPVLVSVDAQRLSLADVRRHPSVTWLHCPPEYPAVIRPREIGHFTKDDPVVGISLHNLDPRVPLVAVARGAKLIEMHFQLDDEPSELEQNISLTASQFKKMVDDVRATEAMLA